MPNPIGVGVIGASADRTWATRAHLPAIAASPHFTLRAVSTSRRETADKAAAAFHVPAFDNVQQLIDQPDVDLIVIAVKVPLHADIVRAGIRSGKPIFCEWPLGNGLEETEQLTATAAAANVRTFLGLQGRSNPGVNFVRELVHDGFVGDVLSTTVLASGGGWGPTITPADAYTLDVATGASMLTIPFAHTLDALCYTLGKVASVTAETATRRPFATEDGTGRHVPITVADQILLAARLTSGATASLQFRGGMSPSTNFLWEINGTAGDLVVTAANGHIQMNALTIQGSQHGEPLHPLEIPQQFHWAPANTPEGFPFNVAQAYTLIAGDLRDNTQRAPTFADAVHLSKILTTIEQAASSGRREPLS